MDNDTTTVNKTDADLEAEAAKLAPPVEQPDDFFGLTPSEQVELLGDTKSADAGGEETTEGDTKDGDNAPEGDTKDAKADTELADKRQAEMDKILEKQSNEADKLSAKFPEPEALDKRIERGDDPSEAAKEFATETTDRSQLIAQAKAYKNSQEVDAQKVLTNYPELDSESSSYNKELHEAFSAGFDKFKREAVNGDSEVPYSGASPYDFAKFSMDIYKQGIAAGRQTGIDAQKASSAKAAESAPKSENSAQIPKAPDSVDNIAKAMDAEINSWS